MPSQDHQANHGFDPFTRKYKRDGAKEPKPYNPARSFDRFPRQRALSSAAQPNSDIGREKTTAGKLEAGANANRAKDWWERKYEYGDGQADYGYRKRAVDAFEEEERRAYPNRKRVAAYRSMLGPTPLLGMNDRTGAYTFLKRIEQVLDHGKWTKSENQRLHFLWKKWKRRVDGTDDRFRLFGNKPGTLDTREAAQLRSVKAFRTANLRVQQMLDGGEID